MHWYAGIFSNCKLYLLKVYKDKNLQMIVKNEKLLCNV